jgi:hypothetical protein
MQYNRNITMIGKRYLNTVIAIEEALYGMFVNTTKLHIS